MRFLLSRLLSRPCTYTPPRIHARWRHTHIDKHLDMANLPVNKTAHPFDKARFEALLNRRFFYAPAFEIYGGECFTSVLILLYCLEVGSAARAGSELEGSCPLGRLV